MGSRDAEPELVGTAPKGRTEARDGGRAPVTVLHVCAARQSGGIERVILQNHLATRDAGIRSSFCYLHHPENADVEVVRRRAVRVGCPFFPVSDGAPLSVAAAHGLIRVLRKVPPHVVHVHEYKSSVLSLLLRPVFGFRTVATVHGWSDPRWRPQFYFRLDRLVLPLHDHVVAASKDLAAASRRAGVPDTRLLLMENTTAIGDRPVPPRPAAPAAPSRLVIGSVGRLAPEKGLDLLVATGERLLNEGWNIEIRIVGEGVERKRLAELIAGTEHPDRFRLMGFIEDVEAAYAEFDILCIASRREGLPIALLEAFALGTPVVATAVGGIPSFVEAGREALIVAPDSVEALADGLRRLLVDPSERASIGARARVRLEQHRAAARGGELAGLYRRLAEAPLRTRPGGGFKAPPRGQSA